jgi:magnesium chelatase family protein
MGLARTSSVALVGSRGHVIEVEVDISQGLPGLTFTGLPDTSVSEARDRVRAAILNAGGSWPQQRITVALLPADVRKHGSIFDLAVALAILAANREFPARALGSMVLLGELGLDGRLRPVRGVLPAVLAVREQGYTQVVVPIANAPEAALVTGVTVRAATSLAEMVLWLRGHGEAPPVASPASELAVDPPPDLSDVVGQPLARRALEIAAAGGHHLMLVGSPGAGKTMLAERLPSILPPLDDEQSLEVTAIHSVAGLLPHGGGMLRLPPLQMPHHGASMAAMVGGGSPLPRPGAVSLAHRGVLVLDEAPEFKPTVLDSLRQPLESGRISINRVGGTVEYPARFQLVVAMNPCPCAAPKDTDCVCVPQARIRYGRRLSGPLLDRIDLRLTVDPVEKAALMSDLQRGESSEAVAARVLQAREVAKARWQSIGWATNAEVPGPALRSARWRPPDDALAPLRRALDIGQITARGFDRALRIAWTVADLSGATVPDRSAISEAVHLRTGHGDGMAA